jgi:hypothetical protein
MKVPTTSSTVFALGSASVDGGAFSSFGPADAGILKYRNTTDSWQIADRLRGFGTTTNTSSNLSFNSTAAENTTSNLCQGGINNPGTAVLSTTGTGSTLYLVYGLKRAPGFFDEVCYTGTGSNLAVNHNLGVTPELIIVKCRNGAEDWPVYTAARTSATRELRLNDAGGEVTVFSPGDFISFSSTTFTVGTNSRVNGNSSLTFVAYLFATCPGVSKCGSYTGTGTTQTINCGFTSGARFVMIKRLNALTQGGWYVWDSARGIVAGNDPYLLLNSGAVEVTNTDFIDTASTGFEISSTAPAEINASGGTFIFLAIA